MLRDTAQALGDVFMYINEPELENLRLDTIPPVSHGDQSPEIFNCTDQRILMDDQPNDPDLYQPDVLDSEVT